MKTMIGRTDAEILKSVREQVSAGSKGKKNLTEAKTSIGELFKKINDIKVKAETSERMVTEICQDIKTLDYAKKNLTTTIATLQKLKILINGVEQLNMSTSKQQYNEAGQLLGAINQLAEYFATYRDIPKIEQIQVQMKEIREGLKAQVYKDFRTYLDTPHLVSNANLADACTVIDALGPDEKREFTSWFCTKQLAEYGRYFQMGEESAQLEHCDRRFAWLKRALITYDEQFSKIFPTSWRMDELLCEEFCFTTRQNLIDILENTRHSLNVDVLVSLIKRTMAFEKELSDRFGTIEVVDVQVEPDLKEEIDEDDILDPEELANPKSAAAIRAKWKRVQRQNLKREQKKGTVREIQKFKGIISSIFDMYMGLYITKEEKNIEEMLQKVMSEETWMVDDDEKNKVLTSSTDLIFYFKNSIKLCSSLSKNQALYDLSKLFKKFLTQYCNIIISKIPGPEKKITEREEKMLCLIINTAEYCSQITTGITDSLKKIIHHSFVDKIDLKQEQSEFEGAIAKGTKGLVHGLVNKLIPALDTMVKMPWASWESVEDQSDYVNQINTLVRQSVPTFNEWLSNPAHFTFFCESFRSTFIPKIIDYVYRCKRVSIPGAQQLILDLGAIKTLLLELPNIGKATSGPIPARYTRHVQKDMGKAELILKVVLTPQQSLVDTYRSLIVDGSEGDFQKILEMKGLTRPEQKALLDVYNQNTGSVEGAAKKKATVGTNIFSGLSRDITDAVQRGGESTLEALRLRGRQGQ
eukprot:TRINITY_DN462_c5_g1_i2.p1 TRINITY_DN462_c5_g1~~TRINITY_DN462_c5_g1_i2.p1  ORF type:complete len:831 (-),score=285.75 TRINITY_DN462_c5_g1_i2:80-2338(-)